jgi:hypothetical protein
MKGLFKKAYLVGQGGMTCACCAPKSGNKYAARARQKMDKQGKLRLTRMIDQLNKELTWTRPPIHPRLPENTWEIDA